MRRVFSRLRALRAMRLALSCTLTRTPQTNTSSNLDKKSRTPAVDKRTCNYYCYAKEITYVSCKRTDGPRRGNSCACITAASRRLRSSKHASPMRARSQIHLRPVAWRPSRAEWLSLFRLIETLLCWLRGSVGMRFLAAAIAAFFGQKRFRRIAAAPARMMQHICFSSLFV